MEMRVIKFMVFLTFSVFLYTTGMAQSEVWPVQVTGSMLPPHSLNLKVYGTDRTNDMVFQAMFMDPVQASIYVKPRISIEQNGTILSQTDPNYIDEPVLLNQFENTLLDGGFLSRYLSNFALSGYRGQGQGSADVPEGFNQICLQLYGVDRDVPVSNKFCVSGNFRLNQPPQVIKPAFNEKIRLAPVQNMVFSWMPMHVGSANNPGVVEYTFELAELAMGVMNANDAFDSALKIYKTTTTVNSLIYSQAEPVLEPNKYYVWRVTARSFLYPTSKLFQNDGKSEISVFVMYDGEEPTDLFNPSDNPSPRGCLVYDTDYGPVVKSDNQPSVLIPNQIVKVGYFNMLIGEVSGGTQGYSGRGWIDYPMLKSYVEVKFQDIKVNKEDRVYEAGSIEAVIKPELHLTHEQLNQDVIRHYVTPAYGVKLFKSLNASNTTSALTEGIAKKNTLPIAIDNPEFANTALCVTGIKFTPRNAYLTLIALQNKNAANSNTIRENDMSISAATAITATPYGIRNGAYLVPLSVSSMDKISLMPTIEKSLSLSNDSRLYCDCHGIQKAQTAEDLYIHSAILADANSGRPIKLDLKDPKQSPENYSGPVGALPSFTIPGQEQFVLSSGGGTLHLDPEKSLSELPSAYWNKIEPGKNRMLWLKNNTVQLPGKYTIGTSKNIELKGDILIGEDRIEYAEFSKKNIMPLEKGVIEKWRYSVDEMRMTYASGAMSSPTISGKVQLPVSSHHFDYTGSFYSSGNQNPVAYVSQLPTPLSIDIWKGEMQLDPASSMHLSIRNINEEQTLYPAASISGDFSMKMDKGTFRNAIKGNIAQTLEDIKRVFDIQSDDIDFGVSGMNIQGWAFDPFASKGDKYVPTNLDVSHAQFHIAGSSYPITSGEVVYASDDKERLGLSFTTFAGNNRISFTIWGVEKDGTFVFDGIEEISHQLKCDCDTGNATGMLDDGRIYDGTMRDLYMPRLSSTGHHGGESSYAGDMHEAGGGVYPTEENYRLDDDLDGFVLKDANTLYWPLLERDIEVVSNATQIYTAKDVVLTVEDFKKMGFKSDVWIPEHYQLVISELTITKANDKDSKATLKFKLQPGDTKSEILKSTYHFASDALPVKGNSITIADVKLKIVNAKFFLSEGIVWRAISSSLNFGGESHAILDCTNGLSQINLFGFLMVSELLGRDSIRCTNLDGGEFYIPMQASIENVKGRSFDNFIATVNISHVYKGKTIFWGMKVEGQPHISFKPGENYEIYFDHHSKKDVEGFSAADYGLNTDGKSFKGLVFKKFETEIRGFEIADGKPLILPSKDAVLFTGTLENRGFYYKHKSQNLVTAKDNASFSGWKYTLDSLTFTFKASVLTENVTVTGDLNLPLFKQNPVAHPKKKFDKGVATFKGVIISDKGKIKNTLGFLDLKDKVFQSVLVPGMAMQLSESSKISLHYENGKWMPFGVFSGKCDFYMDHNVALSLNVISVPGMDISTSVIAFENIVVSSFKEGIDGPIKIKLDGDSLYYVDLGFWGESGGRELAKIDEIEDFDKRTKQLESLGSAKSKAPAPASKAKSSSVNKVGESESTFMGFDLVYNVLGPKKRDDGKVVMGFKLGVGLMGANTEKTDQGEKTEAMFIRAQGVMGLEYGPQKDAQDIWKFDEVTLECLAVEGKIGPVGFAGGLNILRSDEVYGSGLKGYLSAEIDGLGGMNLVGQFGKKKDNGKEFYYGFLDVEAFMEQGIPIPPPSPVTVPVIDFFGIGGGLAINMMNKDIGDDLYAPKNDKKADARAIKELEMPSNAENARKKKEAEARKAKIEAAKSKKYNDDETLDFCENLGSDFMKPGVGLMQAYTPQHGAFGGMFFVIFGPYTPVKPPYTLVADAGINMQIDINPETNEFTFGEISIKARGYIMPTSIGSRRQNNLGDIYAEMKLDWRDKSLDAGVSFRTKFELPAIPGISPKPTIIFESPINYDKTNFATLYGYNSGRFRLSFNPDNPYASIQLGGPNTGGKDGKPGGLDYISAGGFTLPSIFAYIQAGAYVDPPPKLEDMLPELSKLVADQLEKDRNSKEAEENKTGKDVELGRNKQTGIAFGLKLEKHIKGNFVLLHADLKVKLGFDANLTQNPDAMCGNSTGGKIGMNGWYAEGKAYAFADGRIDMGFDLFGKRLTATIFTIQAYLAIQKAMGPNPSYFRGLVGGRYDVLDGMFSGKFDHKVIIGEPCQEEEYPDPIANIKIFGSASVVPGQTNVDRYSDIKLSTNVPLRKDYTLTQVDSDGNPVHAVNFIADVININVLQGGNPVAMNYKLNPNAKSIDISFKDVLEPMTEYTIEYEFGWKEKKGGDINGKYENRDNPEKGSITFTTGARPTKIFDGMIEYSAPGNRQRYWHKGYADTEIKFKLKALSDAVALFPAECKECGIDPITKNTIKYKYVARLQEFDANGNRGNSYDYPITNYPGKGENAKILTPESKSIDGKYSIHYMAEKSVPVSKVSFPDLKNVDLRKGMIYELSIVRELDMIEVARPSDSDSRLPQVTDATYNKMKKLRDDNRFVLQTYCFGTSQYSSLGEKLANLEVKFIRSQLKLRDFSHPNDVFDSERASVINVLGESKFHSVKDDYYAFTINNRKNNEGFDKFDILKMKQNIKLEYNQDYLPEKYISQLQTNAGMQPDLKKYLEGGGIPGKGYLKKVLFDHTRAEEKGIINFGDQKVTDGTKWHYRISGPTDDNRTLLNDAEIQSKKVSNPTAVFATKNDPNSHQTVFSHDINYDFLLQDLRSRIVINQLYWLSRLHKDVVEYVPNLTQVLLRTRINTGPNYNEYRGEYNIGKKGEFVTKDGRRDFSWIESAPQGINLKAGSMDKAYIADEPGYRLSYHGASTISFPSDNVWGELTESRRDKGAPMKNLKTFEPTRSTGVYEWWPVSNVNELSTEEWYHINYHGNNIGVRHFDKKVGFNIWGLNTPFSTNQAAQYELYTPAYGILSYREFVFIEDANRENDKYTWNFTNSGENLISIKNKASAIENDRTTCEFPYMLPYYLNSKNFDLKIQVINMPKTRQKKYEDQTNDVKLSERNYFYLSPEKVYTISQYDPMLEKYVPSTQGYSPLMDKDGCSEWRIIRDGRFYQLISARGNNLYGVRYDPSGFGDYRIAKSNKKILPARHKNEYYEYLWNITHAGEKDGEFYINNVYYNRHFLSVKQYSGSDSEKNEMSEEKAVKLVIKEKK